MKNTILAAIFLSIFLSIFKVETGPAIVQQNLEDQVDIEDAYFDQLEAQNAALDKAEADQD